MSEVLSVTKIKEYIGEMRESLVEEGLKLDLDVDPSMDADSDELRVFVVGKTEENSSMAVVLKEMLEEVIWGLRMRDGVASYWYNLGHYGRYYGEISNILEEYDIEQDWIYFEELFDICGQDAIVEFQQILLKYGFYESNFKEIYEWEGEDAFKVAEQIKIELERRFYWEKYEDNIDEIQTMLKVTAEFYNKRYYDWDNFQRTLKRNLDTNGKASRALLDPDEGVFYRALEDFEDSDIELEEYIRLEKEGADKEVLEELLEEISVGYIYDMWEVIDAMSTADYRHMETDYDSISKKGLSDEEVSQIRRQHN